MDKAKDTTDKSKCKSTSVQVTLQLNQSTRDNSKRYSSNPQKAGEKKNQELKKIRMKNRESQKKTNNKMAGLALTYK